MSVKPSSLPRWANAGGAIVTPGSGKQDVGWVTAERPPAQYLNWWQNLVYLWVVFISAYFTSGGAVTGNADLGNTAETAVTPLHVYRDYNQKIRSLIDHNGYRMGQVSEVDETWLAGNTAQQFDVPIEAGILSAGAPTYAAGVGWTLALTSQSVAMPLSGVIPFGATLTSVTGFWSAGNTTDVLACDIIQDPTNAGAVKNLSSKTGTAGAQSFDFFSVASTTGYPRLTVNAGYSPILLFQPTAVTTSIVIQRLQVTAIVDPAGWSYSGATLELIPSPTTAARVADNRAYVDPDANVNQRTLQLLGQSVANPATAGSSVMITSKFETFHDANCAYAMEFMLRTGTITDAANKRILAAGIQNNNGGALNRFVYLYNQDTTTNWQLRVVGSATTDTDTGVAIAANTTYRVRIEIYGTSVNSSGSTKIRCYINGTKVAEVNNATLPAADMIRPYFKVGTSVTTAAGPYDMRIGRVRRAWNHLLTADNL